MNVAINPSDLLARLPQVESLAPVTAIPDPLQSAPEFAQGQRYQGTVEARLANGNFRVLIAGQLLQMNLPEGAHPGDRLELMLIAREPRLKFALLGEAPSNTGTSTSSISTTGRFLGALVQDAGKSPVVPSLTSPAPLLSGPPGDGRQLPGLLQQTLSQSGLFYESHQAQWIAGNSTLEQLRQEPQGRLTAAASPGPEPEVRTTLPQSSLAAEPAAVVTRSSQDSETPVHAQSLTLVQQQLAILETGQLNWRGEIWPGQWLEWDIAEHPPAEHETDEPSRWQTRLRLTLPKLGEVAATLALDSRGVRITLGAAATGTAALLESSQQPLAAAMAAAGLNVLAVEVQYDAGQ